MTVISKQAQVELRLLEQLENDSCSNPEACPPSLETEIEYPLQHFPSLYYHSLHDLRVLPLAFLKYLSCKQSASGKQCRFLPGSRLQTMFQHTRTQIGADSANGSVFLTRLVTQMKEMHRDHSPSQQFQNLIVVKLKKKLDDLTIHSTLHEYFVGVTVMNHLRSLVPNFMYTFGLSLNQYLPVLSSITNPRVRVTMQNQVPLYLEHIVNEGSIASWMKRMKPNNMEHTTQFISLVLQMLAGSHLAFRECKFVHMDLHSDNLLVAPLPEDQDVASYVSYPHQLGQVRTYGVLARFIDYGYSQVQYKGNMFYWASLPNLLQAMGSAYQSVNWFFDFYKLVGFLMADAYKLKLMHIHNLLKDMMIVMIATCWGIKPNGRLNDPYNLMERLILIEQTFSRRQYKIVQVLRLVEFWQAPPQKIMYQEIHHTFPTFLSCVHAWHNAAKQDDAPHPVRALLHTTSIKLMSGFMTNYITVHTDKTTTNALKPVMLTSAKYDEFYHKMVQLMREMETIVFPKLNDFHQSKSIPVLDGEAQTHIMRDAVTMVNFSISADVQSTVDHKVWVHFAESLMQTFTSSVAKMVAHISKHKLLKYAQDLKQQQQQQQHNKAGSNKKSIISDRRVKLFWSNLPISICDWYKDVVTEYLDTYQQDNKTNEEVSSFWNSLLQVAQKQKHQHNTTTTTSNTPASWSAFVDNVKSLTKSNQTNQTTHTAYDRIGLFYMHSIVDLLEMGIQRLYVVSAKQSVAWANLFLEQVGLSRTQELASKDLAIQHFQVLCNNIVKYAQVFETIQSIYKWLQQHQLLSGHYHRHEFQPESIFLTMLRMKVVEHEQTSVLEQFEWMMKDVHNNIILKRIHHAMEHSYSYSYSYNNNKKEKEKEKEWIRAPLQELNWDIVFRYVQQSKSKTIYDMLHHYYISIKQQLDQINHAFYQQHLSGPYQQLIEKDAPFVFNERVEDDSVKAFFNEWHIIIDTLTQQQKNQEMDLMHAITHTPKQLTQWVHSMEHKGLAVIHAYTQNVQAFAKDKQLKIQSKKRNQQNSFMIDLASESNQWYVDIGNYFQSELHDLETTFPGVKQLIISFQQNLTHSWTSDKVSWKQLSAFEQTWHEFMINQLNAQMVQMTAEYFNNTFTTRLTPAFKSWFFANNYISGGEPMLQQMLHGKLNELQMNLTNFAKVRLVFQQPDQLSSMLRVLVEEAMKPLMDMLQLQNQENARPRSAASKKTYDAMIED